MGSGRPEERGSQDYLDAFKKFAERHPELANSLMGRLLDLTRELTKRFKSHVIGMALTAAVFELLNRKLLGEASALGFKVAKLDFLRYFAPVVLSFLLLQAANIIRDNHLVIRVTHTIAERVYPELYRSFVLSILTPGFGVLRSTGAPAELIGHKAAKRREAIASIEGALFVLAPPLAFNAYSIVQHFRQGNPPYIAATATLLTTAAILTLTAWVFYGWTDEIFRPLGDPLDDGRRAP